ncbi:MULTISPECIES: cell division protein ZapE [Halomonas]|uniref:Cell division protein ZapE n=1 Tax=Halomonas shengliensis TaxID=419597 RepID=A0A1H0CJ74_9GAMM|nr:cell division protein ZapE [Halomonas shengliensis]SDN57913.1 cell division protein ZapE [Halomonas shengliensis]
MTRQGNGEEASHRHALSSPLAAYHEALAHQGFVADSSQRSAAEVLEACFDAVHGASPVAQPGGVYLWGPVGRGKTWLMDAFHQGLRVPARRQHFHHFMRWVHRRLFQHGGTPNPLLTLAGELAAEVRVLCLDELFVSDIADAMLLGRLLTALFEQGVVLVCTSNQAPRQLYADGFNRERFLPAIAAIERHMREVELDGGQDHRLHPGWTRQRYWVVGPEQTAALSESFGRLSEGEERSTTPIELGHRTIAVRGRSASAVWCDYAELCEQPLAALDFIELVDRFEHILLEGVPCLSDARLAGGIARGTEDGVSRVEAGDRELPPLSRRDDGVRRFIALVDECYDRRTPLYLAAEVPMEALYPRGHLAFPFRRTLSRLREMQLARFGTGDPPKQR